MTPDSEQPAWMRAQIAREAAAKAAAEAPPAESVPEPEPEEESQPSTAPTPEEIRDNVTQVVNRGKEVLLGPFWETVRTYGRGISDGVNAVFEGITGKKK